MKNTPGVDPQVSTSGVLKVEKRRPVDVLAAILDGRVPATLEAFFRTYDAGEAAAMCYQLVTSPATLVPSV